MSPPQSTTRLASSGPITGIRTATDFDMTAARRSIVGAAFATLRFDDHDLPEEIAEAFSRDREAAYRLHEDAQPTLDRLRSAGFRLAILTNGGTRSQRAKLERFDLARRVDHIQIEEEVGVGKPDRQAFDKMLRASGCQAAGAWMVGDRLDWDVRGSQSAGMVGVWYNPANEPAAAGFRPDLVIGRLAHLIDRLV